MRQEILPIQSPAQPLPSIENVIFSAQESEWQCKAAEARYGKEDFFSKPIHCQKAALAANDVGLYSLHPYKEEKDISTASDRTISYSLRAIAADRTMSYSLRSSAKQTDDEGDGSEPCKFDDGRPECVVQSERSIDDPTDEISAEFSGQTKGEYEQWKVEKALTSLQDLNNGECRKFLNEVLKNMNIKREINGKKVGIDTMENCLII